ncbi:MAG: hypothetical protein MI810_15405 [Flavobacteriales bacterium]|jgi:hypothetical protein|nr:hypothetical protein [Flavobacteriales bacterium]
MKNTHFLILALALLFFSSCRKTYVCTCTVYDNQVTTQFHYVKKKEVEDLKADCEESPLCVWSKD